MEQDVGEARGVLDSALRLNPHPHTLALDGVYVRGDRGTLDFHPLPAPSAEEVADVARRTARVRQLLEQRAEEQDEAEPTGWTVCCAASACGLSLFGPRAGQPPLRLVDPSQARPDEPIAILGGFNVHAARPLHGADHAQVDRCVRYLARPPIAQDRLELLQDGRVRYRFKQAWRDGSTAIDLEPFDLLTRLCALIPPPRFNLVRYHGVLTSHAKLRAEVVPSPPEPDFLQLQAELPLCVEPNETPRRKPWAWLLQHVFFARPFGLPSMPGTHPLARGRHRARRHRPSHGRSRPGAASSQAASATPAASRRPARPAALSGAPSRRRLGLDGVHRCIPDAMNRAPNRLHLGRAALRGPARGGRANPTALATSCTSTTTRRTRYCR